MEQLSAQYSQMNVVIYSRSAVFDLFLLGKSNTASWKAHMLVVYINKLPLSGYNNCWSLLQFHILYLSH